MISVVCFPVVSALWQNKHKIFTTNQESSKWCCTESQRGNGFRVYFFATEVWLYFNWNLFFFVKMCILAHYLNYFWIATMAYSSYVTSCINLQNSIICVKIMSITQFNNLTFSSTIVVLKGTLLLDILVFRLFISSRNLMFIKFSHKKKYFEVSAF